MIKLRTNIRNKNKRQNASSDCWLPFVNICKKRSAWLWKDLSQCRFVIFGIQTSRFQWRESGEQNICVVFNLNAVTAKLDRIVLFCGKIFFFGESRFLFWLAIFAFPRTQSRICFVNSAIRPSLVYRAWKGVWEGNLLSEGSELGAFPSGLFLTSFQPLRRRDRWS